MTDEEKIQICGEVIELLNRAAEKTAGLYRTETGAAEKNKLFSSLMMIRVEAGSIGRIREALQCGKLS